MTGPGPVDGSVLRVLYVGGMPRSGSTLTDLLLHQLPGHVGIGELFYLWRNGVAHDGLCGCGEAFAGCPFWTKVGDVAFGGWGSLDVDHVLALQQRVDRTARIPQLLLRRRSRRFAADLTEYTALLRSLYRAVAEVSGATVVVDSSKRPSLAYVLRTMPDVELRVVHVVRDPRGVAFSFAKHVELPEGAALRGEMPRSTTRKVSRRWVSVNALVGALGRLGVPLVRIRYEDLVADPARELGKVQLLLGVPRRRRDVRLRHPAGRDRATCARLSPAAASACSPACCRCVSTRPGANSCRGGPAGWSRSLTLPLRRRYGYP